NAGEAWSSFAAWAAAQNGAAHLLEDPPLRAAENPGAIPTELLKRVRTMVRSLEMSDENIDRWFASFATRLKPGHSITPPRRVPTERAILKKLEQGIIIARSEEARWAFLPSTREKNALVLYVGGAEFFVAPSASPLARALCASRRYDGR